MSASETAAQSRAERAAAAMFARDRASQALGMQLAGVRPGWARLTLRVREDMVNGHGGCHGGLLFALADSAFAFACNSHGEVALAAHCSITFLRPAKAGDRLIAAAREISRFGRSGLYDVEVSAGGVTIAQFRGHSRTIGGSLVDGPGEIEHQAP